MATKTRIGLCYSDSYTINHQKISVPHLGPFCFAQINSRGKQHRVYIFQKRGKKRAVKEANKQKRITALIKRGRIRKKSIAWAAEKEGGPPRRALHFSHCPLARYPTARVPSWWRFLFSDSLRPPLPAPLPGVTEATASGTKADVLKTTSPRARGYRGRMPGDCDTGTLVALAGTAAAAR